MKGSLGKRRGECGSVEVTYKPRRSRLCDAHYHGAALCSLSMYTRRSSKRHRAEDAVTPFLHPDIALLIGRQDHRHRLRMDWLDHRVRRCREKAADLMRSWRRLRLRAAIPVERRPEASKGEQRAVILRG